MGTCDEGSSTCISFIFVMFGQEYGLSPQMRVFGVMAFVLMMMMIMQNLKCHWLLASSGNGDQFICLDECVLVE